VLFVARLSIRALGGQQVLVRPGAAEDVENVRGRVADRERAWWPDPRRDGGRGTSSNCVERSCRRVRRIRATTSGENGSPPQRGATFPSPSADEAGILPWSTIGSTVSHDAARFERLGKPCSAAAFGLSALAARAILPEREFAATHREDAPRSAM
jgi:hypothetical protein